MNYSYRDITVVFGIRAQDYNPWVLDRLEWVGDYYCPMPVVLVIDFGSPIGIRERVQEICNKKGFGYHFVDDELTFSPAIARNIGATLADTKLVFFNDIDCFWTRDFFEKLARAANVDELSKYWDRMLNMPVYHVTEKYTRYVAGVDMDGEEDYSLLNSSSEEASFRIEKVAQRALNSERRNLVDFVAPYSNVFLIRKDYFEYLGGYNETFRGHGSEDFEFLLRYALISKSFPLPKQYGEDYYGPLRESFYTELKEYKGYRRLFELISASAELQGLKVLHLHHEKPPVSDWVSKNDWKRSNFKVEVEKVVATPWRLLEQNWLRKDKKALVLLKHKDQYEYYFPLRAAGYSLEVLVPGVQTPEGVVDKIQHHYYDAVSIFNPYMTSHSDIRPYFELAKKEGVRTIVIERGGLPRSWYYSTDVAYNDPDYDGQSFLTWHQTSDDLSRTEALVEEIRAGGSTLEKLDKYEQTVEDYSLIASLASKVIFVPLQLHDDMAVTRFTEGYMSYADYFEQVSRLGELVSDDTVVLVKPHPLSSNQLAFDKKNIILCKSVDNVHALIDLADVVVCYNSGVGLLSLIHGKPTFTIGNSYYSKAAGLASAESDLFTLVDKIEKGSFDVPNNDVIFQFVSWLINEKYSYFVADSVIRDFGDRKSHAYKNILPERINLDGLCIDAIPSRKGKLLYKSSYLAAKYNIYHQAAEKAEQPAKKGQRTAVNDAASASSIKSKNYGSVEYRKYRLNRKLRNDPYQYFSDVNNKGVRSLRLLFSDRPHGHLFKKMLRVFVKPIDNPYSS